MSSFDTSAPSLDESRAIDWGRYALVAFGTMIAAVVVNVLIYYAGSALIGYDPQFVVLASVSATILFTIVPAIVAVLLYAILLRFTKNPVRTFTIIAAVVLVISVIPDFFYIPTVPGASLGQTVVLMLMHVAAAVVIVWTLTNFTQPESR